jgi:hypothetical protein
MVLRLVTTEVAATAAGLVLLPGAVVVLRFGAAEVGGLQLLLDGTEVAAMVLRFESTETADQGRSRATTWSRRDDVAVRDRRGM